MSEPGSSARSAVQGDARDIDAQLRVLEHRCVQTLTFILNGEGSASEWVKLLAKLDEARWTLHPFLHPEDRNNRRP